MLFLFVNIILSFVSMSAYLISTEISVITLLYAVLIMLGVFVALTVFWILLFGIVSLCYSKNAKVKGNRPIYRWFLYHVVKYAFLFLRVKYTVKGEELLPQGNKRFLIVSNHVHESDPLFLVLALTYKRPIGVIAKKDIWNWFFVPNAITALGCIPIDRENDREAVKSIITAAKLIKEDKLSMAVFPEGYTEKGRGLLPFRDGVFKIAQRGEAPIVVAVIKGSEVMFKNLFRRKTHVEVNIIDYIPEETVSSLKTHELGALIHEEMEKQLISDEKN